MDEPGEEGRWKRLQKPRPRPKSKSALAKGPNLGGRRLPGSLGQEKKEINLLYLFIFVFSDFISLLNTLFMF